MGVLSWNDAVDIGGNRGRLAPAAAASLARVDADMRSAFGRAADINEAWRSPEDADRNYAAYQAYLRDPSRNPWAPIALPGNKSVHCFGEAVDTDDTSDAQMRIWNDHGWYWTVYRNGRLAERWHLEYFPDRDNHRNDPAYSNATPFEEDDMFSDEDRTRQKNIDQGIRDLSTNLSKVSAEMLNGRSQYYEGRYTPIDILLSHSAQTLALLAGRADVTVELSSEDAEALAQATVLGLSGMMQTNQDALIAQLRQLPEDTIAALKSAL